MVSVTHLRKGCNYLKTKFGTITIKGRKNGENVINLTQWAKLPKKQSVECIVDNITPHFER